MAGTMTATGIRDVLWSPAQVQQRIGEMAREVIRRYADRNPLFVCLLRGGVPFAVRLVSCAAAQDPGFHPEMDYMTVRTYGDARSPRPSELVMGLAPATAVRGRTVLLLDDVLDGGYTAAFATEYVLGLGASTVDLIVLVQKDKVRLAYGDAALSGFEAPDEWLTGMGMDNTAVAKEANRWYGGIAIAEREDSSAPPDQPRVY